MAMNDTPPGEGAETGPIGLQSTDETQAPDWAALSRSAFETSTTWINASRRMGWQDSLNMFQNRHVSGSKYMGPEYRYRSKLVRPKFRSVVRKDEAATAAAFFSTSDVVTIDAEKPNDRGQLASAGFMQELLNYRLSTTIPWFQIVAAARQDTDVYGFCVSRQSWKYEERIIGVEQQTDQFGSVMLGQDGSSVMFQKYQVTADHPEVLLLAPDNFRFDPACDWLDPVGTSPYLIELIPMYVGEVRRKMRAGEWQRYDDGAIVGTKGGADVDATRLVREQGRQPSQQSQTSATPVRDFDIGWVHLNIMRWDGADWVYFTLGSDKLLTEPKSIVDVYGSDQRPYAFGITNLEAHRNYPASKGELLRDMQAYANDVMNMRNDVLKLSLQPRPFIKAGTSAAQHLDDYRVMIPGKPFMVQNLEDVQWPQMPQVNEAAYAEQDRINVDFDDLAGGFQQGLATSPGAANETLGGMQLIAGAAGSIGEYELRLFSETWVKKVLEQLVDLEQRFEEDETILALAGEKAQLVQKYGMSTVTDWLLSQRLTTKVSVGTGATNPMMRLANMKMGAEMISSLFGPAAAAGLDWDTCNSVIWGALGYADGKQFFKPGFDPQAAQMEMERNKTIAGVDPHKLEQVQIESNTKLQVEQMRDQSNERIAAMRYGGEPGTDPSQLNEAQIKAAADMRSDAIQAASRERVAQINLQREREKQAAETQRATMQHQNDLRDSVIRTLPPAISRLLVAHHQGQTQRAVARMRPRAGQ